MPAIQPKRLLIMNILDILKRYTDEDHRLSQKEIADILCAEYNMTADRKSIRRNLMNLMDYGYPIEYSETVRMTPNSATGELEESYIWSDFYLEREFTDGELRLLIDGILFSKHVPYNQCRDLVEKLEGLSNMYFRSRVKHIARMPVDRADNQQLFLNIEILDEAISKQRKVAFHYLDYATDKKMYPKTYKNGKIREYVISPYQMAAKEGKYYLICNHDHFDSISNYRLDRIADIRILDEKAKPFEQLDWANGSSLDLAGYMKEHPYMYASDNVRARFRVCPAMISDVIDIFGSDVRFSDEDETGVNVTVMTNALSMKQFAKSYGPDVVVLEPESLREQIKEELKKACGVYLKEGRN